MLLSLSLALNLVDLFVSNFLFQALWFKYSIVCLLLYILGIEFVNL
jgi:hypothetical protein